jgi:hypothetical protein
MNKPSSVSLAIKSKFQNYLMGYVIGCIYHDGSEWLTHGNDWTSLNPNRKEYHPTLYPTAEDARKKALQLKKNRDFQWFYRGYIYSTPNPENAKGLQPADSSIQEKIFV